ncbi:MAG: hypothetical protein ACWGSD_06715, partial [Thermodesulfobacteriota bacterium]
GIIRSDLIDNLLVDASLRETHINAILSAIDAGGYQGIELAYLAINPNAQVPSLRDGEPNLPQSSGCDLDHGTPLEKDSCPQP